MTDNWQWLAGTYWYVPASCLAAPLFPQGSTQPLWMADQTVWQITGYKHGYFWGNTAAQLHPAGSGPSDQAPAPQRLTASITPDGTLHMTFVGAGSAAVIGLGKMVWQDGAWAALMQMSAPASENSLLLHWAYMFQCQPGDPAWERLPGTDMSVPEFLAAAGFAVE